MTEVDRSTPPSPLYTYVIDPAEKALSTFAEQFSVYILPLLVIVNGHLAITGSQLLAVTDMSAFAALTSIITSILTFALVIKNPWADLAWRTAKTYLQSVLGVITTAALVPSVLHTNWPIALIGAVPVAGTALVKGILGIVAPWSTLASLAPYRHAVARAPLPAPQHERARDAEVPQVFRDLHDE